MIILCILSSQTDWGKHMEQQVPEIPVLLGLTAPLQGKKWTLDRDELLIGRAPECDVVVPDRQVSRYHARVRRSSSGYLLEDLASKNGTHLNGTPVAEPVLLHDGDVLQVALAATLTFVVTEATLPLPAPTAAEVGLGRLRLDLQAHRVFVGDRELEPPLSPPQYRLLELLYRSQSRVVPREEVIRQVWPEADEAGVSEQAIDALIRRLRDRLATADPSHEYIVTVRGHGFRLQNPV